MKKKIALLLAALLIASAAAYGCAKKDTADPNPDTDITTPSEDEKNDDNKDDGKDENTDDKKDETGDNADDTVKDDQPVVDGDKKDDTKPEPKPDNKPNKPADTEQPEVPEVPAPDTNIPDTKPETKPETKPDNTGSNDASVDLSGKTTAEIISMIYEKKPVDLFLDTVTLDLSDADTVKFIAGLSSTDGIKEISVSEPMMGSQAYSMVLVRVSDSANAASVAQTMKDNINPRKWVCVEADDIKAASKGDLALFFMVDSQFADTVTASEIMDAFKSVCGGSLDSEI